MDCRSEEPNRCAVLRRSALVLCSVLLCLNTVVLAAERTELDGAVIRGDQEQPQVLFLLPWQSPPSPDIAVPPPTKDLGNVLEPLERQRFREELYFRSTLEFGELKDD